jgi:hypothetical protein
MHRTRVLAVLLVVAASIPVAVTAASAGATVSRTAAQTSIVPCVGQPVAKPASFTLACGDGNWYLTGLDWVRWSSSVGIARGIDHLNDCTPDCAAGTFHTTSAVFVVSDPVTARGERVFSVVSVLASSRLPGSSGSTTVEAWPTVPSAG